MSSCASPITSTQLRCAWQNFQAHCSASRPKTSSKSSNAVIESGTGLMALLRYSTSADWQSSVMPSLSAPYTPRGRFGDGAQSAHAKSGEFMAMATAPFMTAATSAGAAAANQVTSPRRRRASTAKTSASGSSTGGGLKPCPFFVKPGSGMRRQSEPRTNHTGSPVRYGRRSMCSVLTP